MLKLTEGQVDVVKGGVAPESCLTRVAGLIGALASALAILIGVGAELFGVDPGRYLDAGLALSFLVGLALSASSVAVMALVFKRLTRS